MRNSTPYDAALRALGTVTVAFTMLDTVTNGLLRAVVGTERAAKFSDQALGRKLSELRNSLDKNHADKKFYRAAKDWLQIADDVKDLRNTALKSSVMFYGIGESGLRMIADGGRDVEVIASSLVKLTEDTNQTFMAGGKLAAEISEELGLNIQQEG